MTDDRTPLEFDHLVRDIPTVRRVNDDAVIRERNRAEWAAAQEGAATILDQAGPPQLGTVPTVPGMGIKGKIIAVAVIAAAVSFVPFGSPAVTAEPGSGHQPAGRFVEAFRVTASTCTKEQQRATPGKCQPRLEASPAEGLETTPDPTIPAAEPTDPSVEPTTPSVEPAAPVVQARPVAPNYKPRGRASSYKLLKGWGVQAPHWNYCKPFTYMVNPDRMTPSLQVDIEQALDKFANASGIRFQYAGATDYVPFSLYETLTEFGDGQLLIFAVSDKDTVSFLSGNALAVGGSQYGENDTGEYLYYEGGIVIDDPDGMALKPGFGPLGQGMMLLHELGHVAGLDHVNDETQLMAPRLSRTNKGQYGAGDLAGFTRQADQGCA